MTRKMKDSGIEWIGQIPEDWEVVRNKYMFLRKKELVGQKWNETQLLSLTTKGIINKDINNLEGKLPESFSTYQYIQKNDLVLCLFDLDMSAVFNGLSKYNGMISPAYKRYVLKTDGDIRYYNYLFDFAFYDRIYKNYSTTLRFTLDNQEFDRIPTIEPSTEVQKRLSDFLDNKIEMIEKTKNIINKEIQTLEEYKKSVITEAVTKGLDKNIEMKDSGIEWIGEIPKHWIKAKVKHACALIGSGTTPTSHNLEFYSEDGINWIQSGDLYKTSIITTTEKRISDTALKYYSVLKLYESPFLVMAMYGASVGNLSLSKINATTNQACCVMKPNKKTDLMFLYYWLVFVKDDLLNKAEGGSQPNISQDKIKNEIMYFPTLCEQQSISNYLDKKTAIIDEAITSKQKQLGILEEYKKSLIYEYVTGKKEVEDVGTI